MKVEERTRKKETKVEYEERKNIQENMNRKREEENER